MKGLMDEAAQRKSEQAASVRCAPAPCSDERLQSLRKEGWRDTWMAAVLVNESDTEVAVVFPNGIYFRGELVNPLHPAGSASEVDVIRREHAAIAASYAAQRDTINGSGLPYGPCQCSVCAAQKTPNDKAQRPGP